jgi:putative transposase
LPDRAAPRDNSLLTMGEFTDHLVDLLVDHHTVRINLSRPGKLTDNTFIKTFNRSLRNECLNVDLFETLPQTRQHMEAARIEFNERRAHMAPVNFPRNECFLRAVITMA